MNRVVDSAGPASAIVRAAPVIVPLGAVTEAVWPLPRSLTVLPKLSVTLTLASKLPPAMLVPVQVNRQIALSAPLLVACVQASLAAAPGLTVTVRAAALSIALSLTVTVPGPALTSFIAPLLDPETVETPAVKVIAVAVPKLIAAQRESEA